MKDLPDPARDACRERCAEFGDPPCWVITDNWKACADCLSDIGVEAVVPLDPSAVVRPLL